MEFPLISTLEKRIRVSNLQFNRFRSLHFYFFSRKKGQQRMLLCSRTAKPWWSLRHCRCRFSSSPEVKVVRPRRDEGSDGFLRWLERKTGGVEISSKLYVGKSAYGRALFASESIKTGECILKVPYNAQIVSKNLVPEVRASLVDGVGDVTKVAFVVLMEQMLGLKSEWAPYISCLPPLEEMHSTIFWSKSELEMICQSMVYQKSIELKAQLEKDFFTIKPAFEHTLEILGSVALKDFTHAYALVKSRAWECTKGVSLIPFADFLNHNGISEAVVWDDDEKQVSEVNTDCDYAPHEEVFISYGKFSNAHLLLDFGFTLPYNIYDQVQVQISIPRHDPLREMKLEVLCRYHVPILKNANCFESFGDSFIIKEVRSVTGKGKGLPQSLRAFARVLCCTSPQEISHLVEEAAQGDGRLARRPFKDSNREVLAHKILLS